MSKEKEQSSSNQQPPKPAINQRPNTTSRLQTFSKEQKSGNQTKKKE